VPHNLEKFRPENSPQLDLARIMRSRLADVA
jgi:hypothetical protein